MSIYRAKHYLISFIFKNHFAEKLVQIIFLFLNK